MTHPRFLFHRDFTKRPTELQRFEKRVVAEPALSSRRAHNLALNLSALDELTIIPAKRRHAHIARTPIARISESLQQQRVVRIVQRLTREIVAPTPSFAMNTRRTTQRRDLDARIIGNRRAPRDSMKMPRLRQRVSFERRFSLERIFDRTLRDACIIETDDVDSGGCKHRP